MSAYALRVPVADLHFAALSEALPVVLVALAYGAVYLRGVRRLAGTPRAVPTWRRWCFAAGMTLIVLALVSPLARLADELFVAHMAEHLLLGEIGRAHV